mmetsp:Transcript_111751/g.209593  ORF Transcript_111751/g.209593 Transcript_111751/m.209593 type:complete len:259 (+) Transcript_111751:85-861(+)
MVHMRTTSRVARKPSKKSRRASLAELWVRSESKWCEEANPFGLDAKQVTTSKALGKAPRSPPGALARTKECIADLDKHITELDQRLLSARTQKAANNAAVEVSANCSNLLQKPYGRANSKPCNLVDMVIAEMAATHSRVSSDSVHPSISSSARQRFSLQRSPRPQSPQMKSPKVNAKRFTSVSPTKCNRRWTLQTSPSTGAKPRQMSPNHAKAPEPIPMQTTHRYAPGAAPWHERLVSRGLMPAGSTALSTKPTAMAH